MQTNNSTGFSAFLAAADGVSITIILLLLLMSVATWYLILAKFIQRWQIQRLIILSADSFWNARSLETAASRLEQQAGADPFSRMARQGIAAAAHCQHHVPDNLGEACTLSEFVTRALRRAIANETARLEAGLTLLASVGSTAPFVGLFGTVWGIYHALIGIGARGQTNLDAVAGPVGEALIMTAAGLAVAIPAVLAYNALVRSNRLILAELDAGAHDLHAYLTTGARVGAPRQDAGTRNAGTGSADVIEPAKQKEAA